MTKRDDEAAAAGQRPTPTEVYGPPGAPVGLLIGNGGAGALGLFRPLAEDFLRSRGFNFAIGWVKAGSGDNVVMVREGLIDMALTYEPNVERQLVRQGKATCHELIFHDRFILTGPAADPAGVGQLRGDIGDAFFRIAEAGATRPARDVLFLSRDNTSATTVKERAIWSLIELDPWMDEAATWYVRFDSFPIEALSRSNAILAYTLSDMGTWLANREARARLAIFLSEGAILSNPCSVIVAVPKGGEPSRYAVDFASYLTTKEAQRIIAEFGRDEYGEPLYLPARRA